MRTDALSFDTGTFFESLEKHLHAILRQRLAGLREKEVILPSAAPLGEFLLVRTMFVQVVGEVAQTVLSQGNTPLFRSLPHHRHDSLFAIQVAQAQIDEFRDSDAGI